jgi:hypothetical protein
MLERRCSSIRSNMRPVVLDIPAASGQLVTGRGCLTWHASQETSGSAAASYIVYDAPSASHLNHQLLPITLSAGQSTRDFIPPHIIPFNQGIYYDLVSGSISGVLAVMLGHECDEMMEIYIRSLTVNV